MTELLPELERQLRAAVRAQRAKAEGLEESAAGSRRRAMFDPARIVVAFSVVIALAIGATAIVLVSHRHSPQALNYPSAAQAALPAVGCTRAAARVAGGSVEVAHGVVDGHRWRVMGNPRHSGAALIQDGRFVLGGRAYGFCRDPISFQLIDASPHGVAYGYIAGRDASPVAVQAAAGPPRRAPRIAQVYPAAVRLLAGGTFFVRALPAQACAYTGMALNPGSVSNAHGSSDTTYFFSFGRCRPGDLVQPRFSGSPVPSSKPSRGLSPAQRRRFVRGRTLVGQSGCLACHEIGSQGNAGGRPLNGVGSKLKPGAIMSALLHSPPPMPSYRGRSKRDIQAIVSYLSRLK